MKQLPDKITLLEPKDVQKVFGKDLSLLPPGALDKQFSAKEMKFFLDDFATSADEDEKEAVRMIIILATNAQPSKHLYAAGVDKWWDEAWYRLGLGKKSQLKKWIESWRGVPWQPYEEDD